MHYGGSTQGQIRDGLSKTIAIAEDVGRTEFMPGAYADPGTKATGNWAATTSYTWNGKSFTSTLPTADSTAQTRAFWRWIEADNGFGVSGPSNQTSATTPASQRAINNNSLPTATGPSDCLWNTVKGNCGPNDEIFSFHADGANAVFMDGHVSFLSQTIDPLVLRRLVTAYEGVGLFDPPSAGSIKNTPGTSTRQTVDY